MTGAGTGPGRAGWAGSRSELVPRILSGLVMAGLAVSTAWLGGPVFGLFWLAAGIAVLWEWLGLVGAGARVASAAAGSACLAVTAALAAALHPGAALAVLAVGAAVVLMLAGGERGAVAALGVFYAGALALALPLLRGSTLDGLPAVLWLFAVVWGADTMAFVAGRTLGGPKLAPRVSPSKTWSGFACGVASGAVLGVLVAPPTACAGCLLAAGVAAGALSQAGDLFESALKRRFGAKDAGSLIPGHGGVMDRLDGFVAAAAFAAAVGLWRFGPAEAGAGVLRW